MRQSYTKLLSAFVLTVAGVVTATAAGPRSTSPADGDVIFLSESNPLRTIMIECPFTNPGDGSSINTSGGDATLSKDGTQIQSIPATQAARSTTAGHLYEVYYTLNQGIYEPGTYTFSVPAGVISYGANDNDNELDAFSISFTVLDANSVIVTPANGSMISPVDLQTIVIKYAEGVKLQINSTEKIALTQMVGNTTNTVTQYSVKIKGNTITLESDNDATAIASVMKTGSSAQNLILNIPAGMWSADGVDNLAFNYSYLYGSFTANNVSFNPAPRSEPYVIDQLRRINVKFTTDMATTASSTYVKLQQKVDGTWGRPNGYSSDIYYRIEFSDKNNAVLTPRPVSGTTYTNTVDELESGEYSFVFVSGSGGLRDAKSLFNKVDVRIGSYFLKGATEAAIISQTPEAGSAVRANDWENMIFEFSSEMDYNEGVVLIKDADGNVIRTLDDANIYFGEDAHTAEIRIDPIIARDPQSEKTYTVEVPAGLLKQRAGSQLPSAGTTFTITVGKYVKIEDNNYPKYSVNPPSNDACNLQTSFKSWVFTYYGADAVEIGTELPKFMRGTTEIGGGCTVTSGVDDDGFPTVTVTLTTQQSIASGYTYQLQVPRQAWTVSRGDKVYTHDEILTYKVSNLTDKISTSLRWKKRSGLSTNSYESTITYNGNKASELTAEDAAAAFASVNVGISPADSGIKSGSGAVTLNSVNGTTLTSIATYDKPNPAGATSVLFKTTGLTANSFNVGQTYAFKIAKEAIQINGLDPDATIAVSSKDLSMDADLIHYFKIVGAGQGSTERELNLLNSSNGVPRVRLEHLDIAAVTDNETYGFAITYKTSGMYIGDKDGNKLINEDGNPMYSFTMTSRKGNVISYSISPSITEQGEYTLIIPSGCFAVDGVDINKEFVRHFTIKDNKPTWSIPIYESAESSSSNGVDGSQDHPIRGFGEIVLTYPEDIEIMAGEVAPKLFTITYSGSGQDRAEIRTPVTNPSISLLADRNMAAVIFDPVLTEDADYKLELPLGSILMMGAMGQYVPVEAYEGYFTINDITTCEITPASESTVVKLDEIDIKFTEAKIVNPDPQPEVRISVFDEEGNEVDGYSLAITMDDLNAKVSITPAITTAGKYRIAVPEGRFLCQSSANDDPEKTLAYNLWYTVVDPTEATVHPAVDSEVTKIETISVEFAKAVRIESKEVAYKVLNGAGTELSEYTVTAEVNPLDAQEYILTVTPAITKSGKYSIVVPAGAFACKYTVDGEARDNEEMILKYTVKNPTVCTIAPADESENLTEIDEITFTFSNAAVVSKGVNAEVTVRDAEDNELPVKSAAEISIEENVATITFTPAITHAGDIVVTVKEGTFECKRIADEDAVAVQEYVLNYNIEHRSVMEFDYDEEEMLTTFTDMIVTFSKATNVEINDEAGDITVTHVVKAPETSSMQPRTDANPYTVKAAKVEGANNQIKLTIEPTITEEGTATLHIPYGKFIADGQHSQEIHPEFVVKGDINTWVNKIFGDDADVTVITINGVVIMKDAPASELRSLEPGMYIINGRKVVIR